MPLSSTPFASRAFSDFDSSPSPEICFSSALSDAPLSETPLSGDCQNIPPTPGVVCLTGAISDFAFGSVSFSDTCPSVTPSGEDICQTGAFGDFAFASISISGTRCIIPINPSATTLSGHSKRWRPIQDRTSRRLKDDNEIALWLAHFISSID